MSNNKILIVTEYFYPRDRPDSYLITEIAKKLAQANDGNIKIICNAELNNNKELEFVKNRILRLKENTLNKDALLSRIIKFSISTFKLGLNTFFSIKKNDKVFSVTNPAFLIVVLGIFKKFKKFHYTLLVYDVFPENLVAANILRKNFFLYTIIKKIFNWSYMQADHLIVIGRDMEELMAEKTNNTVPMSLITNWCDVDEVIPKDKKENSIIRKFNLEDKVVFSFTGNFGRVQGIDKLLEMASLVKNSKFRLLFIGKGAMLTSIKKHIENNLSNNVIYAGEFPASEKNIFLNACDVAIVSLNNSMDGLGVPSKSYYNMAAKKPLFYIGSNKSEIGRVVNKNHIGWVLENKTAKELAQKVDEILKNPQDFNDLGTRARKVVEENFSKEIILNKYKNLFDDRGEKND